jgi:hypothetical protein
VKPPSAARHESTWGNAPRQHELLAILPGNLVTSAHLAPEAAVLLHENDVVSDPKFRVDCGKQQGRQLNTTAHDTP